MESSFNLDGLHEMRRAIDAFLLTEGEHIRAQVQACVVSALRIPAERVVDNHEVLVESLGADSLDFVDIVYRLEDEFGIELAVDSVQEEARRATTEEFEVEGRLSESAIERLRALMPEVDQERFKVGIKTSEIPELFTLETLSRMVAGRLLKRNSVSAA